MAEETPIIEVKGLDAEQLEGFKNACIINLLRALGGKFVMGVAEFERAALQQIWGYGINIPTAPTGNIRIDARVSGATIELFVVPAPTLIQTSTAPDSTTH
jgi:hypothetical protein